MANEREVLRLHFEGYSQRDICTALKCGHSRVSALIKEAHASGIGWEVVASMDDLDVASLLTPPKAKPKQRYAQPDFESLAKELAKPDVTRKLLWHEYCSAISDGEAAVYQYPQFCKLFDSFLSVSNASYRIIHEPGKRLFVDWAGSVGHIVSAVTGEISDVYIFVACLPYSARLYAEGFLDMKQASWTEAHIHTFEYFGGTPAILVPDNTKTAVQRAPIYTTLINERYHELADHYGCAVIPARVRKPNDKALVESGVNIIEKSVLAALRNETFFTLAELNEAIFRRVDNINAQDFQRRPGSRDEVFCGEEKPCLRPLPALRYESYVYKSAKVSVDYHVQVDTMRYSVPYTLIGQTLEVRLSQGKVDVLHKRQIVASHTRLWGRKGQYATLKEHMPASHQAYDAEWTPGRFERWADGIGVATRQVINYVIVSKVIVEQAFVPCMNILNLARRGKKELLEEACAEIGSRTLIPSYSLVKTTMEAITAKRKLGTVKPADTGTAPDTLGDAGCVRGAEYYSRHGGDAR